MTLTELARALDAAKSSVQELTNGLLARGYLVEEDGHFHLGPGPFILAARANKLAALSVDHRFVVEMSEVLGCTVLVGVRVGDTIVFVDHVGEESPGLTHVARTHARRPLYTSAAGKTLLANLPDAEMYRLLDLAGPQQAGEVRQFLTELPEIRSRGARLQPRNHVRRRVRRGHALVGIRRQSDRGDQCCRRRFRSRSARRHWRRTQEGRCHSRPPIRRQTAPTRLGRHVEPFRALTGRGHRPTTIAGRHALRRRASGRWQRDASASPAWSGRRDSNPRPSPWQGDALPTEPRPRGRVMVPRLVGVQLRARAIAGSMSSAAPAAVASAIVAAGRPRRARTTTRSCSGRSAGGRG